MKNRHLLLAIAGMLLVVVGLMALWWPVFLGQYDQYGIQITCGRAYNADLSHAADAGGDTLVSQCGTALLTRRAWAIPTAILGWLLLTALVAGWLHHAPTDEARAEEPSHA
ncbi:hypothetical protein A5707_19295 [Mycobacterium kyorinense]|uniref:Transmembrane protein n=1 Tax=Mycobacterium kyorinense TaxID=487514 RepID=A0A1A2ZD93_9MYCO|nr:hypothetical protein [Mycobacterium kyorinense]OBI47432.1 hypothetical protein A5707_19295 [Mycobacterium kyorinense]